MHQLDCVEVVADDDVQNVRRRRTAFRRQQAAWPLRRATEATGGSETEFCEMPPRRLQLAAQPIGIVHMVDGAEINLRVRRPQSFEWREKRFVAVPSVGRCRKSTRRPDAATIALSRMTLPPRSGGWRDGQPLSVPKQP
jgi:hypothetical protein